MRAQLSLICAALLCGLGVASSALRCDRTSTDLDALANDTVASLRSAGYKVVEGQFKVFESKAFGANPGNPYVTYFHPGLIRDKLPVFTLPETSGVFWVGCPPASTAYFSWRSYAFTSRRKLVFASLGDTLNNLVINTTSQQLAGGNTAAVITTADAGMFKQLSSALTRAGLPDTALNLDAVPSSLLDLDETEFIMLHRASVWGDQAEKEAYFAQTRRVFFVDAPTSTPPNPLPVLPLRPPGSGSREEDMPGVSPALDNLTTAVTARMQAEGYDLVNSSVVYDLGLDGFVCLQKGTNCKGDNRDTHYLVFQDSQLSTEDKYVVVGPNSVQTHKCTYTNFGLYSDALFGKMPHSTNLTVDDQNFLGSAAAYGIQTDQVFAYSISRDCGADSHCLQADTTQMPVSRGWALAYRTVLDPATKTGNKLSELILPKVLKFSIPRRKN